jgi:hypothetical protein
MVSLLRILLVFNTFLVVLMGEKYLLGLIGGIEYFSIGFFI